MKALLRTTALALACAVGPAAFADDTAVPALLAGLEAGDVKPLADEGLRGRNYYTNLNPTFHEDRIVRDACASARRGGGGFISRIFKRSSCTGNGWFSGPHVGKPGTYAYTYEVENLWTGRTSFRKY